jgi:hypothetical protein
MLLREIHEADDYLKVVAEDVAAVSKKQHEVWETSYGLTSRRFRRRHWTGRRRHVHGRRTV